MKGLLAWIVGATLVATSTGAPRVIADENGEVHYWSSSTSYVPGDEARTTYVSQDQPVQFVDVSDDASAPGDLTSPMPALHGHVYLVNDDPGYDLTGPGDHWFLIGDGTAFRDENWRSTAFASTGRMAGHEVVPITAEFRQDWLAVAAGDRPVRTFTAPRATSGAGVMAVVPMENTTTREPATMSQYSSTTDRDTFRPVHRVRTHRTYHATRAVRYSSAHRRHTQSVSVQNTRVEPTVKNEEAVETAETPAMEAAETAVEVSQDRMGHELYQMGSSWYMKQGKDWYRAESWRGPFAPIMKRTVPREVKMSAKHPSRMDMN